MSVTPLPSAHRVILLGEAVDRFLDRYRDEPATAITYGETLAHLLAVAGDTLPATALTPGLYAAVMNRWDQSAPATWNKHLAALRSLAAYSRRQEWIRADPARHLKRRKTTGRGDKAIPAARLDKLFTDDRNGLGERVLWRMLYETAARAEEVLTLDVTDLDPQFRRALTRSKGGDLEYLHWATATATARLLPRLLAGRTTGPVFLADRRSPTSGKRARALADVDPATGRGRLSYPRAEYLFQHASLLHDPHGAGWTLHQLRHSALKHLAASGRTAPELQAKSRHKHLATLGHHPAGDLAHQDRRHVPAPSRRSGPTELRMQGWGPTMLCSAERGFGKGSWGGLVSGGARSVQCAGSPVRTAPPG